MPITTPYCTVKQVRDELRNQAAATDICEVAIQAACRYIDDYLGRDFGFHDYSSTALRLTVHDNAALGPILFLPFRPIIEITEVLVRGDTAWTVDEDFIVQSDGALASLHGDWPIGATLNLATFIKGTFGYAPAEGSDDSSVPLNLPGNIVRAATIIAANLTSQNQKDVQGLDGQKVTILDKSISKEAVKLLGPPKVMV